MVDFKIEHLPINKLKPNPDNPRFIRDDKFKSLVKSLEDCPDLFEARPCICSDRTGELIIIGGNMRWRAARELKWKEVPVIIMPGLAEAQEKEIAIKDNGDFGEWDFDVLANSWGDLPLDAWGVDLPDGWLETPDFEPGTEDEQGKLDQLSPKMVKCPHCETVFDSRGHEQS